MPKFSLVFAVALVSVFALSASAETPSFDCAKATYPDERTICFSAELSQLDNVANAGYEYLRRVYGSQYANSLDLPLLQARRACATDVTCIKAQQLAAIKKFQSLGAPSPFGGSISSGRIEVQLNSDGGVLTVPVEINGAITLDFVIDSGASDVNIPADVVSTLIRTRTIGPSDFIGQQTYVLADGTEAPSAIFIIRSLKIGGRVVENVRGSIGSSKGSLLLGQSFLRNFRSWSIDNGKHALVLE